MEQLYVKQSVTSSSLSLHPYNCVCGAGRFLPVAQMFCDEGPSSTTMNVPLINIETLHRSFLRSRYLLAWFLHSKTYAIRILIFYGFASFPLSWNPLSRNLSAADPLSALIEGMYYLWWDFSLPRMWRGGGISVDPADTRFL